MLQGISRENFLTDEMRAKAVTYDFQCVSEAATHLLRIDPGIADRHPNVPWAHVCGLANVIRHDYGRLDVGFLWETASGSRLTDLMGAANAELIS